MDSHCWAYNCKDGSCRVCKRIANRVRKPSTVASELPDLKGFNTELALPETRRLAKNHYVRLSLFPKKKDEDRKRKAEPTTVAVNSDALWDRIKKRKVQKTTLAVAIPTSFQRLYRFLSVLDLLGTCHWANIRFEPNEKMLRRMTATHLQLIVGKKGYDKYQTELFNIISTRLNLSVLDHIVWITNRQNGKTTTLARFLAALAIMSPAGGPLVYVYSVNRARSQELIDGTKRYINEIKTNEKLRQKLADIGVVVHPYTHNNSIGFSIPSSTDPTVINHIKARPKGADSCRGDAPLACLFDEVGFLTADFWYKFAYPLIQVGERIFTLATTPAPAGSFFSVFTAEIIKANLRGEYSFILINHNIECDTCREANVECNHKLFNVPTWKPVTGFHKAKELVADKYADDFRKEFRGVITEDDYRFFKPAWVKHIFDTTNAKVFENVPTKHLDLYIAIDPPSHAVSYMGLSAIIHNGSVGDTSLAGGLVYLVGHAEVNIKCSEMIELGHTVQRFTWKVLEMLITLDRPAGNITVIPIVEANNNEFQANTLMARISEAATIRRCKTAMHFTMDKFKRFVVPHVGVLTTNETKLAGIQLVVNMMQDNRLWVWKNCVTIGAQHLRRSEEPTTAKSIHLLRDEMLAFQSTERGPSGKTENTRDDGAMSFMLAIYWSWRIRSNVLIK